MLVLVSFVLVLAAAVTLVVGLLQSGLTLIYLSIGCSVLAGVVLAAAVLRGRPEPRAAASGRAYTPPVRPQVSVSVGAPSPSETTSWSPPAATPPPPASTPAPAPPGEDLATRAAGSALLGRLRGRKTATPTDDSAPAVVAPPADLTAEIPVVPSPTEDEDGFPVADYDRLRATELLALLPGLDRNQLEAVRQRESSGKNRFTIMSRVDSLLAAKEEPAWEATDDGWDEAGTDAESEAVIIEATALRQEGDFDAAVGDLEDDEVDELVSPTGSADFLIAGYDALTVGQILPRLSDLSATDLAAVRAREQQGRNRGTIIDRIDRLQARAGTGSGALAMPAASSARRTPAKAPVAKKARAPRAITTAATLAAPAKAARKSPATKAPATKAPAAKAPARKAPAPAAAPKKAPAKKAPAKKAPAKKVPAKKVPAKKVPAKKATRRS